MCALKETLIFCSSRAEIAENQTHNLILQLADIQCKLKCQLLRVSAVKLGTLIGKEWDPQSRNVCMLEDLDEAGDSELLILMCLL